jgi:CHRD domain
MKKQLTTVSLVAASLVALGGFSVSAKDRPLTLRAKLTGTQETPVVSTQAKGAFEARFEADGSISYKLSYEGLEGGNTLFAHIHLGQRNVAGSVMTFLCGGGTKPTPCPGQSGTVQGTIMAADIQAIGTQQIPAGGFDEFVHALLNGTAYANVHTTASPGGEIRGQIRVDRDNGHGNDDRDRHDH